jgi:hypothetical protein
MAERADDGHALHVPDLLPKLMTEIERLQALD